MLTSIRVFVIQIVSQALDEDQAQESTAQGSDLPILQ